MVSKGKTLVLGASLNPDRYSNRAVLQLKSKGIEVIAMGINKGKIGSVSLVLPFEELSNIHTISIYLTPHKQPEYYEYILTLQPKRILFNPGTENPDFAFRLTHAGIYWENACTLVLLSTNQY
jgi:predicted CoA-binding protein